MLLVRKRQVDITLLCTCLMLIVPMQLMSRSHPSLFRDHARQPPKWRDDGETQTPSDSQVSLYINAVCACALAVFCGYVGKYDHLGGTVSYAVLMCLTLLLFVPHPLFEADPLFALWYIMMVACWALAAMWLDRIPFVSIRHVQPDVMLALGWEHALGTLQFYLDHEAELGDEMRIMPSLFHLIEERSPQYSDGDGAGRQLWQASDNTPKYSTSSGNPYRFFLDNIHKHADA